MELLRYDLPDPCTRSILCQDIARYERKDEQSSIDRETHSNDDYLGSEVEVAPRVLSTISTLFTLLQVQTDGTL